MKLTVPLVIAILAAPVLFAALLPVITPISGRSLALIVASALFYFGFRWRA